MPCDRSDQQDHSRLLLWHAAGTLGPEDRQILEEHLGRCVECTEQVAFLMSVAGSVRGSFAVGPEHPGTATLLAYEQGDRLDAPWGKDAIAAHLEACPECHEADAALRAARTRLEGSAARRERRSQLPRNTAWGALAAAAIVIVAVTAFLWRGAAPTKPEVIFEPVQRGGEAGNVLTGAGPWSIALALPFDAPDASYRIDVVLPSDDNRAAGPYTAPGKAGEVAVVLDPLPPGRYVLHVQPVDGSPSYDYFFHVQP